MREEDKPDGVIPINGDYIGTTHQPMPVRGYRPQSDSNVQLVNRGKAMEAELLRFLFTEIATTPGIDLRMLALAKTNIQQGCMWAWRSVFQPSED